jgi:hypothetical protein
MLLALASIQFGRLGSTFGKPKELFADDASIAPLAYETCRYRPVPAGTTCLDVGSPVPAVQRRRFFFFFYLVFPQASTYRLDRFHCFPQAPTWPIPACTGLYRCFQPASHRTNRRYRSHCSLQFCIVPACNGVSSQRHAAPTVTEASRKRPCHLAILQV